MSRTFTRNHLRILVLPTQLSKFLEPERESGQFFTSWDSAFFTELNNLSGVRKIFTGKISFSEFSLFMYVWASRWVFLDICRRMFGVYFTLCLPPGNARWKNEEKKSPEFCPFPQNISETKYTTIKQNLWKHYKLKKAEVLMNQ